MKKFLVLLFITVFSFGVNINAQSASESEMDFAVTGNPGSNTSISFSKTVVNENDGTSQLQISYYKKEGNNWYHYKNFKKNNKYNNVVITTFYKDNAKCKTTISKFSCSNGRVQTLNEYEGYKSVNSYSGRWYTSYPNSSNNVGTTKHYIYDNKKRVVRIQISKVPKTGRNVYLEEVTKKYHSNNKVKMYTIQKYKQQGYPIALMTVAYNKKGIKTAKKVVHFKKGHATKMVSYKYNKKGKLRSTKKDGNAYRYVTTLKYQKNRMEIYDFKIKKVTKAKYNKKGKLSKAKKIKKTNFTKKMTYTNLW